MADHAMQLQGEPEDHSHSHPSESGYIRIAVLLVAITAIEVAIWYIDWFHDSGALTPTLAVLSIVKFVTVVGYYMHLKFDDARYRYTFMCGLVLSASIIAALVVLMRTHKIEYGLRLISGSN
jgi:cytochrome c oxidase subunit 4